MKFSTNGRNISTSYLQVVKMQSTIAGNRTKSLSSSANSNLIPSSSALQLDFRWRSLFLLLKLKQKAWKIIFTSLQIFLQLYIFYIHEQAMKLWNQIIYSTSAADRPERLSIGDDPPIDGLILDIKIVEFASLFLRPIL